MWHKAPCSRDYSGVPESGPHKRDEGDVDEDDLRGDDPLLMALWWHQERGGEVLPLVLPPPWPPLDGKRFSFWSLAFMAMMAPPRSSPMASGDDGPLQQGAREGLY